MHFKIFCISSLFPKLMHPLSSSVRLLLSKVDICQKKFVPVIIRRVHHVPFTSPTISRLRPLVGGSLDRPVGLKVATHAVFCRFWLQCSRTQLRELHEATPTRYSPTSERAGSKLAMPITRRNEKAGHSAGSALFHHSTSQR